MTKVQIISIGIFSLFTGVGLAFPLSILATPIVMFFRWTYYLPFVRDRLIDDAVKKGHVVEATLIKSYDERIETADGYRDTNHEIGVYVYTVNGRKRKFRGNFCTTPPDKVTLYYRKNPRKATSWSDYGIRESPWLKMYLLTALALIVPIAIASLIYIIPVAKSVS